MRGPDDAEGAVDTIFSLSQTAAELASARGSAAVVVVVLNPDGTSATGYAGVRELGELEPVVVEMLEKSVDAMRRALSMAVTPGDKN